LYTRIFDIIQHQLQTANLEVCLARRVDKKNWTSYSTQDVINTANSISTAMLQLGFVKGDKIAIIATTNRPEWQFIDLACMQIGVITVPIYPTISASDYSYIFNHAEVKALFVSDKIIHRKIREVAQNTETIQHIFSFDEVENVKCWKTLLVDANNTLIENTKESIAPNDVATIIYTSGTTGIPKGVMLSHHNIVSNVKDALQIITVEPRARTLSFLPLCHVFERTINYAYFAACASIYYADGLESISDNLIDVKPHYFTTVPRLLEKVFEKIVKKGENIQQKFILLKPDNFQFPLVVYKLQENEYRALLLQCTHQGCELTPYETTMVCPCHGAEFNRKGEVTQGPADTNLKFFVTTQDDENIYIQL